MAKIVWNDSYLLDVQEIDEQHAKLVGIINELHEAYEAGRGEDAVNKVATELRNYTQYHFSAEEKLMRAANYPHVHEHAKQHKEFNSKSIDFLLGVVEGRQNLSQNMLDYLSGWLLGHIKGTDRHLGKYLKEKWAS